MKKFNFKILSTTLAFCLLFGTLTGCDAIDKLKSLKDEEITVVESSDGVCSLELPSSWKSNLSLNSDASLINHSLSQDKFVMVINEEKSQFPDGFDLNQYADLVINSMSATITNAEKTDLKDIKIGENSVKQIELLGKVEDADLGYLINIIESDGYYHQVMFWTFKDSLESNKEEFSNILNSFKTLK